SAGVMLASAVEFTNQPGAGAGTPRTPGPWVVAGAVGVEPTAAGFGDRCTASCASRLRCGVVVRPGVCAGCAGPCPAGTRKATRGGAPGVASVCAGPDPHGAGGSGPARRGPGAGGGDERVGRPGAGVALGGRRVQRVAELPGGGIAAAGAFEHANERQGLVLPGAEP